jgi:hypothetical protein
MKKFFSSGLAILAGMVSVPGSVSSKAHVLPAQYRNEARLESLKRFFRNAACPAMQYARAFVDAADLNNLDWRLLPSISMVESGGGRAALHNNWFGWDSGRASFQSATAAIREVSYQLAHSVLYRDKDTDGILATYNPIVGYAARVKSVMRSIAPAE